MQKLLRALANGVVSCPRNWVKSQLDIMQIPEGAELLANGGRAVAIDTTGRLPQEIVALLEPVCKSLES